jgi:hypothetical protein
MVNLLHPLNYLKKIAIGKLRISRAGLKRLHRCPTAAGARRRDLAGRLATNKRNAVALECSPAALASSATKSRFWLRL